jgi:hypothetical protein
VKRQHRFGTEVEAASIEATQIMTLIDSLRGSTTAGIAKPSKSPTLPSFSRSPASMRTALASTTEGARVKRALKLGLKIYVAQAAIGFAVGLALPWLKFFGR